MSSIIIERIEQARQGRNPTVICKLPSGWAVMGDNQVVPGYCILLSDPPVNSLNDLSETSRLAFLGDMARLGDALLKVTGALRINYEILGNTDPFLHAHVIPRYASEPDERRRMPIWFYDMKTAPKFDPERDKELMRKIAAELK